MSNYSRSAFARGAERYGTVQNAKDVKTPTTGTIVRGRDRYGSVSNADYSRYEILDAAGKIVGTVSSSSEEAAMKAYRSMIPNGKGIKAKISDTQSRRNK